MSPTAPLRAEMTLDVDRSWQNDGQPSAGGTCTLVSATAPAGVAVMLTKVELELEILQLH